MSSTTRILSSLAAAALLAAPAARAAEPKKTPELVAKGKASYAANCALCHGDKGLGDGAAGAALDPKPRNLVTGAYKKGTKPGEVYQTITKGMDGTTMVGFGHLSDEERWGITYYVLDLRAAKAKK